MSHVTIFFYLHVPCLQGSCRMSILRKAHVAVSNLRVGGHILNTGMLYVRHASASFIVYLCKAHTGSVCNVTLAPSSQNGLHLIVIHLSLNIAIFWRDFVGL